MEWRILVQHLAARLWLLSLTASSCCFAYTSLWYVGSKDDLQPSPPLLATFMPCIWAELPTSLTKRKQQCTAGVLSAGLQNAWQCVPLVGVCLGSSEVMEEVQLPCWRDPMDGWHGGARPQRNAPAFPDASVSL